MAGGEAPDRGRERAEQMRAWSMGMEMAASLVSGVLIGAGIDYLAGTAPWFLIGLGAAGFASGTVRFVRGAMEINRRASRGPGAPQRRDSATLADPAGNAGGTAAGDAAGATNKTS